MRLVIDLQACQGDNRHRGIGRYSMALAKAMTRLAGAHDVWLLLNDLAPQVESEIRANFEGLLPADRIVVCQMPTGRGGTNLNYTWRVRAEEAIRQAYLEKLQPDAVHIASLFEDTRANSNVPANSRFPSAITLYDLIPWMRPEVYLLIPSKKEWYERKLRDLQRAGLLLSISEHTRREALEALRLPESRVINIGGAADPHFCREKYSEDFIASLRQKFGLSRPFVMYTGGIDPRKNMEGLLQAFSLLPGHLRSQHQLAMVCAAQPDQKANLVQISRQYGLRADEVVFTGYVTDEELTALYNLCRLFVFPSLHEGFGLPALEAMSCGAPVIASNTTSLPEVVGRADALFDPQSPHTIARKMAEALADENFLQSLREHGSEQAAKFTWENSAKKAWAGLESLPAKPDPSLMVQKTSVRPRLAYISPLPPERTGIADYSAELLPALAEHYEIDLIVNQDSVSHPVIDGRFSVRNLAWFEENARHFDRILYQFGNSQFHRHMFGMLRRHPGTVVLHDFYLGRVTEWMENNLPCPGYFDQQLRYSHGDKSVAMKRTIGQSRAADEFPCNKAVLDQAAGVIVHSRHAVDLGQFWYGPDFTDEWTIIPQVKPLPAHVERAASRARLGLGPDDFVVACFGFVSIMKDSHRVLAGWLESSLAKDARCRLVFVGENHGGSYGRNFLETIAQASAGKQVSITGFASPEDFVAWLSAADVAVQLRRMSRGETSGCALNCLAYGLPMIVNPVGSMAELPDDAVFALPEEYETTELAKALEMLRGDARLRERIAAAGREHLRMFNDPAFIASKLRDAIEKSAFNSRQSIYRKLIRNVADITKVAPEGDDLLAVAASIAGNHPHRGKCRSLDDDPF